VAYPQSYLTTLTNAIVPDVFLAYMIKETTERADIFMSGAIKQDPQMGALLGGGGRTFQHPFWGDLDNTESGVGSDDPEIVASTGKIAATKLQFVRQLRTRGWSSARLVAELAGSDPQRAIAGLSGAYWSRQFNRFTVATLTGVFADNADNDGGDMILDVSGETGIDAMISPDAVLEAKQTMGDEAGALKLLIMHSRVYTNLQKQNLIDFIPNARGEITIPTYLGYQVLVTDTVPVTADGDDFLYTTYLLGQGVLGFAESPPAMPVEVERKPDQGNGVGVDKLWTRRQFALHAYGFNWTDASCAAEFPTNAELAAAANWDRKFPERKQVAMAALITKNG
jgi:hypothetical protein